MPNLPQHNDATASYCVVTQKDGGVILDIKRDRLLKLNRTGAEIWEMLKAGHSEAQVASKIAERYGINQTRVAEDVRRLVQRLEGFGIRRRSSELVARETSSDKANAQPSYPWYGQSSNETYPEPNRRTVFCALLGLAAFDVVLSLFSLKSLCSLVKRWPIKATTTADTQAIGKICKAIEKACVWYPRKALCLQRSAITTCLLRRAGIPARLTIGARPMPLLAHAWVEVGGSAVNDWPRVKSFYQSLVSY
jgi:transglutaminase superfamily protein/coenzyme PQQ synthesis protein D (PqqD)